MMARRSRIPGVVMIMAACVACGVLHAETAKAPPQAGDDFSRYVNEGWLRDAVVPADRSRVGVSEDISRQAVANTRQVIEDAARDASDTSRVAVVYRSAMDEAAVEALADKPLQPALFRIRAARDREAMAALFGESMGGFGVSPFHLSVGADSRDPSHYAVELDQDGLGLPTRDDYLDARYAARRDAYKAYIASLLTLAHWPEPAAAAERVLSLETAVARVSWTPAQLRDANRTYNPQTVSQLPVLAPGFDWKAFLEGAGLHTDRLVVSSPSSVTDMASLMNGTPLPVLKDWLAFHTVDAAARYLSKPFAQAYARFHDEELSGQRTASPRWQMAVDTVGRLLRDDVGRLYTDRYLPEASQRKVEAMAYAIRDAFARRIEGLDWMSRSTKDEALAKLRGMDIEVGRPHHWASYDGYQVMADDLFGNVRRGLAFRWKQKMAHLGTPVDHSDWVVPTQVNGAYYVSNMNVMVVDAGALQAPVFDPSADPARNFGAIGAVIGHEMSHGFDDKGRHFDAQGRLRDWWTAEDAARFKSAADNLSAQYSAQEPLQGIHIDGSLALGEALADLGGLLIATDAYLDAAKAQGWDTKTGMRTLFTSFATMWREKQTDASLRTQLLSNPHSPSNERVNMTVRNIDAWYGAFGVASGTLYLPPEKRAHIW